MLKSNPKFGFIARTRRICRIGDGVITGVGDDEADSGVANVEGCSTWNWVEVVVGVETRCVGGESRIECC